MAYGSPAQLYTSADLLDGYDPGDDMAFIKSWDFRTYRTYVADGVTTPKTLGIRRAQADHDALIAEALKAFLDRDPRPKLVGIMGGHSLKRSDEAYYAVAPPLCLRLDPSRVVAPMTGRGRDSALCARRSTAVLWTVALLLTVDKSDADPVGENNEGRV